MYALCTTRVVPTGRRRFASISCGARGRGCDAHLARAALLMYPKPCSRTVTTVTAATEYLFIVFGGLAVVGLIVGVAVGSSCAGLLGLR